MTGATRIGQSVLGEHRLHLSANVHWKDRISVAVNGPVASVSSWHRQRQLGAPPIFVTPFHAKTAARDASRGVNKRVEDEIAHRTTVPGARSVLMNMLTWMVTCKDPFTYRALNGWAAKLLTTHHESCHYVFSKEEFLAPELCQLHIFHFRLRHDLKSKRKRWTEIGCRNTKLRSNHIMLHLDVCSLCDNNVRSRVVDIDGVKRQSLDHLGASSSQFSAARQSRSQRTPAALWCSHWRARVAAAVAVAVASAGKCKTMCSVFSLHCLVCLSPFLLSHFSSSASSA